MENVRFLKLHGKYARGEQAYALVDAEAYQALSRHHWTFVRKWVRQFDGVPHGYARATVEVAQGRMCARPLHWLVLGIEKLPRGMVIDHINGDPLDNRRANLRIVTHAESALNRRATAGRSGYRGVREVDGMFVPVIKFRGHRVEAGRFTTASEAAGVWDLLTLLVGGAAAARYTNRPAKKYARRVMRLRLMLELSID